MNNKKIFLKAYKHFQKEDSKLLYAIQDLRIEPLEIKTSLTPYTFLLNSIISQQISTSAARAISLKFHNLFPRKKVNFKVLNDLSDESLRSAGISPQKIRYMRDLTQRVIKKELVTPKELQKMSDEEIIEHLVQIKGVGVWTVQMLLIFHLLRQDVMPAKDLGIQKGYQLAFKKRTLPTEEQILRASKKWKPYCSIAALNLWALKDQILKSKKI